MFHVPESVRDTKPLTPPGTDLSIWQWDDERGRPTAIVFQGDSNKPLWKYTFGNEAQRHHEIVEAARIRKEQLKEETMTLNDRVLARFKQSLDLGKTFFTESLKFHHWRGHLTITDITNAGKRGKKVRELVVTPNTRGGDARAEEVIKHLVPTLTHMNYDQAKGKMEDLQEELDDNGKPVVELFERILRGVDVEPPGTKIELTNKFENGTILRIESSPHDFHLTNSALFGAAGEKPSFRQDTGYWPRSKKDGILFYAWLKENMAKASKMTIQDFQKVWDQLGVTYNQH